MTDRIEEPITVGRRLQPVTPVVAPTRGITRRFRAAWPFDLLDLLALAGLLLLGGGLAIVWPPLALCIVGALVMVYAVVAALPPRGGQ